MEAKKVTSRELRQAKVLLLREIPLSEPSLAPKTAESLAPCPSTPAPARPARRTGASSESPRSTSDLSQRYYGEAPVGLRRYERAAGDAVPPIPPKSALTTEDYAIHTAYA